MTGSDPEVMERARKRVKDVRGFYTHAAIYLIVNLAIFGFDAADGGGWHFQWTALGWGVGLLIHGLVVLSGERVSRWEDRKTAEVAERMRRDGE